MKIIVDRIEGDYLILENESGRTAEIPKWFLPKVKEQDILKIEIDQNSTKMRKKEMTELMNQIFEEEDSNEL